MNMRVLTWMWAGLTLAAASSAWAGSSDRAADSIARGRYLTQIGGCNDCHTSGYNESGGRLNEDRWLTGSSLGWSGPWGTTYASNLRLVADRLSEKQWLLHARNQWRPPMPWFNLRAMRDEDLLAIHRYLRHLGPAGQPAPSFLPPDRQPPAPVVLFGRS